MTMNKSVSVAAFVVGLAVVFWVGRGYVGLSPLALGMTVLIAVVYMVGAMELVRFERATTALRRALSAIPAQLSHPGEWLRSVPLTLQTSVRLRIEGERVGLPGPVLTPYLVGLLVLLGMLGTFLGMVVTLNGAVIALETTTDLHSIRSALAAPVKGLGIAFGTSVAGVASSAMLGLISALCRRARLQSSQLLDQHIATTLHGFSRAHQRQQTLAALQAQAQAQPALMDTLQAMMAQMERQARELNTHMSTEQQRFYDDARGAYSALASAVDRSLKETLVDSARLAGQTIQPLVAETMAAIAGETAALQQRLGETVHAQLEGQSQRFDSAVSAVAERWSAALAQQESAHQTQNAALQAMLQGFSETAAQRSATLVEQVTATVSALQSGLTAQETARQTAQAEALEGMVGTLTGAWQQAGEHARTQHEMLLGRMDDTARSLALSTQEQATRTIEQMSALMQTAAEAPRAAAEVIGELRHELSASIARDNASLAERARIMETLDGLLQAINHASTEQRAAIDTLVASSAAALERASAEFAQRIETDAVRVDDTSGQLAAAAIEVASLAEAFGLAVQVFGDANDALISRLEQIESALSKSATRSDEQLAYYVAQAREIIDLSLMSQQRIVEELQQLPARSLASTAPALGEA